MLSTLENEARLKLIHKFAVSPGKAIPNRYGGDNELESDAVHVQFFVLHHTGMFERQRGEFGYVYEHVHLKMRGS